MVLYHRLLAHSFIDVTHQLPIYTTALRYINTLKHGFHRPSFLPSWRRQSSLCLCICMLPFLIVSIGNIIYFPLLFFIMILKSVTSRFGSGTSLSAGTLLARAYNLSTYTLKANCALRPACYPYQPLGLSIYP